LRGCGDDFLLFVILLRSPLIFHGSGALTLSRDVFRTQGPVIKLDESDASLMCMSDAIMWAKSGAMSPLGTVINPF
jgi:hypothetical protein